ncbi:MAG TPA: hypothetical protein VLB68_24845 [Pyrinomonadaceae bacterium]|nr:hypothetical protein [Pyrinomonadaceae bacterium]
MQRFGSFIRSLLGQTPRSRAPVGPDSVDADFPFANEFAVPTKRIVNTAGYSVELDLTTQVLAIKAPMDKEWDFDYSRDGSSGFTDATLTPTLASTDITAPLSASVLVQKAKLFDDGLYAAVEVVAQEGTGQHAGKARLIASLGRAIADADPSFSQSAQKLLLGAASLGDVHINVPANVQPIVTRGVEEFLADQLRSKPIGFYTWSAQLRKIFQQDRMLQGELDATGVKVIANALQADPVARDTYERQLRLISRLTNPFVMPDIRTVLEAMDRGSVDVPDSDIRFFPPSIAHETNLAKKLFGNAPIPDDFVLVDELIRQIRSGELDLGPTANSGWYDYQTWALEPLVIPERMPEGKRLFLDDEYRKFLLDLFKGALTLTRESHIKQLEVAMCGAAMGAEQEDVFIDIDPALSAEPLPTFYLRRALGYRFIRTVLKDTFGAETLLKLHRLTEVGPVRMSLAEELDDIETLFLGAHVSVSRELGLVPEEVPDSKVSAGDAAARFVSWMRDLNSDPDLDQDLRTMIPVFYDVQRRKTKVWTFLGWSHRAVMISFDQRPRATVRDLNGKVLRHHPDIRWGFLYSQLQYPVTAEIYVDRILDRDEFRKLCDSCGRRSEILKRLDA